MSSWPMILISEAERIVLEQTRPLGSESVPIEQALGRVLAQTVTAPDSLPPFPASIKVRGRSSTSLAQSGDHSYTSGLSFRI